MEKEKQNYDFDNIQSQLDKALGQATRLQKERETVQLDADRMRDKYEKVQVNSKTTSITIFACTLYCYILNIIMSIIYLFEPQHYFTSFLLL